MSCKPMQTEPAWMREERARKETEDREGTWRNDTGKNYLAIRNLYRLTPNLTGRDFPHL
jgi:hypothetical protein